MREIGVGLLGLGTVGGGVVEILNTNQDIIAERIGAKLVLKKVLVRDINKPRKADLSYDILTTDAEEVLNHPEIDIIIEVMGGTNLALEYIQKALSAGKNVVTANKDLLAVHGRDLFALAAEKKLDLEFEAAVGGGIPIIRPLKVCLAANAIEEIKGIINGTTNFILTKMTQEGLDYGAVLKEAQELGYAEADPTSDVEGLDAARKLAILASIAFNTRVTLEDVYVEGITRISAADIQYAKEMGYTFKLLGIGKETAEGVEVRVHPTLVSNAHPLAAVSDAFNAIYVKGNAVGETMFYGKGAGGLPTGSAVMADVMDVARNILNDNTGRISCTCFHSKPIKKIGKVESKYYIRINVVDRPGVLAAMAGVFGQEQVSIHTLLQKAQTEHGAEIVFVTHKVKEENLQAALKLLKELPTVLEIHNVVRVAE